jgi:Asp-tRNA(Asn)/Glu-tRNA(Gln) amidotransferase A subunit family amidase
MQRVDVMIQTIDIYAGEELGIYANLTGHPKLDFPNGFMEKDGLKLPTSQTLMGRIYDESTVLALGHAIQNAVNLTQRSPLEKFLAEKDEILKDEKFPDEDRYYTE